MGRESNFPDVFLRSNMMLPLSCEINLWFFHISPGNRGKPVQLQCSTQRKTPPEISFGRNKQMKGEGDVDNIDILGNTTESAIQATKQALYNLDHPLEYVPKSIEVQRACMKEREFYVAFLERLEKL